MPWRYRHIFLTDIVERRLAYISSTFKLVLNVRSLKNFAPALSSIAFNFKLRYSKVELSFKA